jgi:hypothetical protein
MPVDTPLAGSGICDPEPVRAVAAAGIAEQAIKGMIRSRLFMVR